MPRRFSMRLSVSDTSTETERIQVLAAILHEPDLSLLDEPFSGLDPINVELLADTLLGLKAKGKTIIFSSHQMAQVEELCEEVALIARGRLVLSGNLTEIRDQAVRRVVQVRTASGRLSPEGLPLRPLPAAREYLRFAWRRERGSQRRWAAGEAVEFRPGRPDCRRSLRDGGVPGPLHSRGTPPG
jgi:ABC-type multidrug transport system ATPase subunit